MNFTAWSAAVDQVKSHISAFENATKLKVNYENFPWAQYRTSVVTRLVANAPMDVMWVSDAWLPEFAEAQWLAAIDDVPELMKYNADAAAYCTQSMTYKGKQYGLSYYGDHMSFVCNTDIMQRAGIDKPPATWDEVVQASLKIKQAGIVEYPLLLALAIDTWLIEFVSAVVFSHGGRFVDPQGAPIMAEPGRGAVEAATWIRDAIHTHKILSPGAIETPDINALRAFGAGQHAFYIVPTYRLRALNDPSQAKAAGHIRPALMPRGPKATASATCGWIRFYGLTAGAKANAARRANAVKFIEFFGGKDTTGAYRFQKLLLTDLGLPFCTMPLSADAGREGVLGQVGGRRRRHRPAGGVRRQEGRHRALVRRVERDGERRMAIGVPQQGHAGSRHPRDGAEVERAAQGLRLVPMAGHMRAGAGAEPCRP